MVSRERALKQLKELKKYSSKMRLAGEDWNEDWKTLISIIMSARTRDEMTIPVAQKLFEKFDTIEKLSIAKLKEIEKIIKPINFYKNKSKNVLGCAKDLVKLGKVPQDYDGLRKLPGVGDKTANVFLAEKGKYAVGVDTHVHYISKYLGWTKNKTSEKIEKDLRKLFPKNKWNVVNVTLVRFGKTYTSRKKKNELLDKINHRD